MTHDWLVRTATRLTSAVHYVPRQEAERIAATARSREEVVTEGPRPLTAEERACAKDRDATRRTI